MDVSLIADATNNLIVYLATIIEIAHYTLVIYGVRNDWDVNKARKQPVATWLMSIACCYGGGMIISVCVGKPALTPLSNNQSVLMMTIVWWHIFYSPKDVIYNLSSWKPAMLVIVLGKEMIRTRKIIKGVKLGRGAFPDSLLICTILGMFGACGGGFVKNAATFVRKQWNHETVKSIHLATNKAQSSVLAILQSTTSRNAADLIQHCCSSTTNCDVPDIERRGPPPTTSTSFFPSNKAQSSVLAILQSTTSRNAADLIQHCCSSTTNCDVPDIGFFQVWRQL
uniref:trimeric intracellular cation channel type B-like n=1 Tax=Styela clava TaxID=7725 RepID=UPI00193ACFF9|nr:trimeric intracellular cation channel type B-like [Styela clava]